MEEKSFSIWYRCLFCTRVFPKAPQLIEHRKLYHALQWKERKLAKEAEILENRKEKAEEIVMKNYIADKTESTLLKSDDNEINTESADLCCFSHEGNEKSDSSHLNLVCNSENRKNTTRNCSDMEYNNGMETEIVSPGQSDVTLPEYLESTIGTSAKNCFIGKKLLDIKIEISDCLRREGSPVPNVNSHAEKSSEFFSSQSPLRKSARLLSPTNLSFAKMSECIFKEKGTIRPTKPQFQVKALSPVCKIDSDRRSDKGFECSICYKEFASKNNLSQHQITHDIIKPYKCDFCSKEFAQKGNLKTHKMLHTGEFPFQCNLCDRLFRTKAFLTAHGIVHREDRNFKCVLCSQSFRTKGILKTHSLKLHGMFAWNEAENNICQ